MKKIAILLAATTALGSVLASAAEARPGHRPGYAGHHARAYGYRRHRGGAGAAAVVGIAGALIGGAAIAAANRHRGDYYDAPVYGPAYGYPAYGPPAYGYDGY